MAELAKTDRVPDDADAGDEESFLREAIKRFERASSAEAINRKNAVDDLKFKQGDQWPPDIRSQRTIEKRPCLTINKMKTFVHQITNDQRQNRPAINVSPIGDKSDPDTAKMLKGLIRQIERQSNADIAYDTGFENAVSNGWGYWRVLTDYEGDDTFDQVIKIGRIRNPFRVYLDPDSQEPDGSDADWCFVSDLITREEFKEQYPDKQAMEWQAQGLGDEYRDWNTETHVRIADYFYFESDTKTLVRLENGHIGYKDELTQELQDQIKLNPNFVTKERDVEVEHICWDTITANQVLDHKDWAGKWIPIVKVIGDETDVEGKVTLAGIIRDAKDSQRMYNFWVTSETELIALAPKAPWIMEEGQVDGHEKRWQEANTKSQPYLLYKGTNIAGKQPPAPQRQQFAGPPAGVVQAKISAAQDMQATTGIRFDATLQERTYDESGKALRELKRVGDLGNFHYVDNLSRSLRHTGRILIDLIPKIYDTPRAITILREDDSEEQVQIDPSQPQAAQKQDINGRIKKIYNPKVGEYEVAVNVGPSFATKRAEAADSMLQFMKAVPNAAPIIGDLIAKNMDWPGADEIAERLAASLPPNLLTKNQGDFPPEAKALIGSLTQQLQKLSQEHQQALAMLGDKQADRQIEQDKINKDFEAKLTKIVADAETKMLGAVGGQFNEITKIVQDLQHNLEIQDAVRKATPEQPKPDNGIEELKTTVKGIADSLKGMTPPKGEAPVIHIHNGSGKKKGTIGGKAFTIESE